MFTNRKEGADSRDIWEGDLAGPNDWMEAESKRDEGVHVRGGVAGFWLGCLG